MEGQVMQVTPSHLCALAVYAVRYALGRASYAPSEVCEILREHWADLDSNTQAVIRRDIARHLAQYPETWCAGEWRGL